MQKSFKVFSTKFSSALRSAERENKHHIPRGRALLRSENSVVRQFSHQTKALVYPTPALTFHRFLLILALSWCFYGAFQSDSVKNLRYDDIGTVVALSRRVPEWQWQRFEWGRHQRWLYISSRQSWHCRGAFIERSRATVTKICMRVTLALLWRSHGAL